ncbi:hypothetical protein GCM10022243_65350 [Saccharothrix violaceirubra]|uniref:DNA-binding GntR family transcriptional regulator n=1 Tax=Saccharothrix violaceirubra TaxID=413306 RepID=A0A7W7T9D1_9PSEU|nr:GntR family transcriptional regulator [Saccharothrix violaceirubra]MBB4968978.1 DNA-binding GntR family transcriptional regulator [Saccharothrix violaceirubra]
MDTRPAYQQIADDLRRHIASDEANIGDKLPSLSELTAKYGRAVMTVQKALDQLRAEGLVVSRQGEGTIITGKPEAHAADHVPSPHELRTMFERINNALDDLSRRVAVVESELFGPPSSDPRPGPGDR